MSFTLFYGQPFLRQGLGGLVVTHSAAGSKNPGFSCPDTQAYLRLWASIIPDKQCWLCAIRLQQTVIVYCSVDDTCGLQTRRLTTNVRSEAQLETQEGPKQQTREPADRLEMLAPEDGI